MMLLFVEDGLRRTAMRGKQRTAAWMERIKGRPAVGTALSLARVADPAAYWAPGPEINRWG